MPLMTGLSREECNAIYEEVLAKKNTDRLRQLCCQDLFFLLTIACKRKDGDRDFIYDRCREVEADPNGYLDLWSREHYKSTIITFDLNLQDILNYPEETTGIFSHTRPIAKAFLFQIKRELETNDFLKNLFPDILYADPIKQSPKWSLDDGLMVKRKSNAKECTLEAWGLVDGQPTSKHFSKLVFDDVVTLASVTTPEMIEKVTNGWATALNLGSEQEDKPCVHRYSGTRYHANDTYKTIIDRGAAKVREHYPTDLGKDDIAVEGKPLLMTTDALMDRRRRMGLYVYACQMLQNPQADKTMGFDMAWIEHYTVLRKTAGWNIYILSDPASAKKTSSDYTVFVVIGMGPDKNYYLLDGVRDRMNLTQRTNKLFELILKWNPKKIGYEKYGKDSDIEHIKFVQEQEGYRFAIEELGGGMPKNDRIRRLVPIFEKHRFYMPYRLLFTSVDGKEVDFIHELITKEYLDFPVSTHDDMLDCISRICDENFGATFPKVKVTSDKVQEYNALAGNNQGQILN